LRAKRGRLTDNELELLKYKHLEVDYNRNYLRSILEQTKEMKPIIVAKKEKFTAEGELNPSAFRADELVYVAATFLPPGSHKFLVKKGLTGAEGQFTIGEERGYDLPTYYKKMKQRPVQTHFDKRLGVFKDWREDTSARLTQMFVND